MLFYKLLLSLFAISKLVLGANILAINTLLSPSHHMFNDVYLLELANRGHNITLLGHDKDKHRHPNYTHIVMDGVYDEIQKKFIEINKMKDFSAWENIQAMWSFVEVICILDQETEGLKSIKNYPDDFKFDLIIWDLNAGHCLFPLIEKFGRPPIIAINPFINMPNIFKNIWQSYIPFMVFPYTDHMTFWQKLHSNFYSVLIEISRILQYIPRQKQLAENYFGKVNLTIEEVERNVSLMLANYNPVFNYVEALPPNIIPVGGLHIQPKPLPKDLLTILDSSKSGVILFSLGSNIQSVLLGEEKINTILKTFAQLKQTIIWKFEDDEISDLPKNVHVRPWIPQNDILGHPNTILFITHGGLLSSHEAIYNGVPIIGVPFFLDQFQNVGIFIAKGMGEKIEFNEIVGDNLYNIIQKVLTNESYSNNVKKLSMLYKEQQNKPLETAIYWTEYILKYKTAEHLNLATRDMNLIELYNLDIILFSVILFLLLLILSFMLVSLFYSIFKYGNQKIVVKPKTL